MSSESIYGTDTTPSCQKLFQNFIDKSNIKHDYRFRYKKCEVWIGRNTHITAICPDHGGFSVTARTHLSSETGGCPVCNKHKIISDRKSSPEYILKRFEDIHDGYYEYDILENPPQNHHTKIKITCPIHGDFYQTVANHLQGKGCMECGFVKTKEKLSITREEAIKKARTVHGDIYGYDKLQVTNSSEKCLVTCPIHGDWSVSLSNHIYNESGCPFCAEEIRTKERYGDTTLTLYHVRIVTTDGYFEKVGVTSKTVERRFKQNKFVVEIIKTFVAPSSDIIRIEQSILSDLRESRRNKKFRKMGFGGWSECFEEGIIETSPTYQEVFKGA